MKFSPSFITRLGFILLTSFVASPANAEDFVLDNPLGNGNVDLLTIIANLARFFISAIAFFAIITFIYGGALLMLSRGNAEQVTKGKQSIVWSMIGMAVALLSYSIMSLFFNVLTGQWE